MRYDDNLFLLTDDSMSDCRPPYFQNSFKRVIQFELNELSTAAIMHDIKQKKLNNFKKILEEWCCLETTSEQKYQHLEPWIQWISAHTGKTFAEHQIFHLSESARLQHPQIWETLSQFGLDSCIVGSMNAHRGGSQGGFFFPDPWSKDGETHPESIQPLWNLISSKVKTHATAPLTKRDLWKGFLLCQQFKLPLSLYTTIFKQLVTQKLFPLKKWRMPAIFDWFLTEIFRYLLKADQCRYYTLFLNACAHYQHHYWRHFQKELFDSSINSPDCGKHDNPLSYGLRQHDKVVQLAIEYAKNPENLVIIATGLSQVPYTIAESQGGENYYRLLHHQRLLTQLDLADCRALPLMSRDWQVVADNKKALDRAKEALAHLKIMGKNLFRIEKNTDNSLFIETAVTQHINPDESIIFKNNHDLGAFKKFFRKTAIKSGHHCGRGSLWLSQAPKNINNTESLPITQLYSLTLNALVGQQQVGNR